jgi:hypothetical protein
MRKLAVYDQAKRKEVFTITLEHNHTSRAINRAVDELRGLAQGHNLDGWINEYDLSWSTTNPIDKHALD